MWRLTVLFSNAYYRAATTAIYDPKRSKSANITTFTMRTLPSWTNTILEQNHYNFRFAIKDRNWPFCHGQYQWKHWFSVHYSYVNNTPTNPLGISCQVSLTWRWKLQTTNYHNSLYFELPYFHQTQQLITSRLINLVQRLEFLNFW